jgi:hypothetical protein
MGLIKLKKDLLMGNDKKYCAICAWRGSCQKKYSVATDAQGLVHCPDYSRDLSIKDQDIDAAVKKDQQA